MGSKESCRMEEVASTMYLLAAPMLDGCPGAPGRGAIGTRT